MPPALRNFIDGPRLPKVVLGVVGIVLIVGAGLWFFVWPIQTEIAALQARNLTLKTELAQARAQLAELARFRRELAEFERRLVVLREKLPTDRETPVLYRSLSEAAQQAGLGVSLFQPRAARPKDVVNEIPITITAEGGYHQLGQFFQRVASLPRVVMVSEFKVTGLGRGRVSIKADLTLATYTYLATPPPPPTPGRAEAPAPRPAAALSPAGEARS